jgi:hypothetical protein
MKKNMSTADKVVRAIIAAVFAVLYLTGIIKGTLGIILLAVGVIFILTSLLGICPLYAIFGMSTVKKTE